MKVKLLGYRTSKSSKNGKTYVDVHLLTDTQCRGSDGCMGGGFEVMKANFEYSSDLPLYVNSDYELDVRFGEFGGKKDWRVVGMTLIKK